MTPNDEYTLETLLQAGMIDQAIADKASFLADEKGRTVAEILEEAGMLTLDEITQVMAEQYGMEMVSLRELDVDQEVIDCIPAELARRHMVLPVWKRGNELTVAISDPQDLDTLDSLRYSLPYDVVPVVAAAKEIKSAINLFYSGEGGGRIGSALQELTEATISGIATDETHSLFGDVEDATEDDAPIIKLVSLIIIEAFRKRASDIHIEPMEKKLRVRYRIDGVLQEVDSPPKRLQAAIVQRIKIMSNMKIAEKRVTQDGRIQINVMGRDLDLRVSAVPSNHGESVVMRILDKESLSLGLPQLGFFTDDQQTFRGMIALADGIVLVTGPTGSGKTTTLYSCLNEINKPDRKIITVEDPVEYQLSGINQVHVRADIGLTFGNALRSILRQAPNIIMIGEIRDLETAEIAVNASLTGHLVFSTLHTNDAPSAITRLIDIGVKPFLVASSLRGVMAQRLVRKNCSKCAKPYQATDRELRQLGGLASQVENVQLSRGEGCADCSYTGYSGRIGIFEIFTITEEVQHLIYSGVDSSELRRKARELGMRTLREDGIRKVIAGQTTLEEVFRVTMGDAD